MRKEGGQSTKQKQASGRTKVSRAQRWPEEERKEIGSRGRERGVWVGTMALESRFGLYSTVGRGIWPQTPSDISPPKPGQAHAHVRVCVCVFVYVCVCARADA